MCQSVFGQETEKYVIVNLQAVEPLKVKSASNVLFITAKVLLLSIYLTRRTAFYIVSKPDVCF